MKAGPGSRRAVAVRGRCAAGPRRAAAAGWARVGRGIGEQLRLAGLAGGGWATRRGDRRGAAAAAAAAASQRSPRARVPAAAHRGKARTRKGALDDARPPPGASRAARPLPAARGGRGATSGADYPSRDAARRGAARHAPP